MFDAFLHNAATTRELAEHFEWSYGGDRVALSSQNNSGAGLRKLQVYNVSSGAVTPVAGPFASGRSISGVKWSQDDQRIAFAINEAGCRNSGLHSTSSTSIDVIDLDDNECRAGFVY